MRLRFIGPGAVLDGYGNLWVDQSVETVETLDGPAPAPFFDPCKFYKLNPDALAHIGVRRVRPFNSADN